MLLKACGGAQAANRHVFGCKNLSAPPSQYPVTRLSIHVVCNKVLLGSHLNSSYHKKRLAAVRTVSSREHTFMLRNCASECVNNRACRAPQQTYNDGLRSGPTLHEIAATMLQNTFAHKVLWCDVSSDKKFLQKRACVHPSCKDHSAGTAPPRGGSRGIILVDTACASPGYRLPLCQTRLSKPRQEDSH